MRGRLDPWTELQVSARAALRTQGRAPSTERCAYVMADGDAREFGQALNALKNMCLAWRHAPDEAAEALKASIGTLLVALDQWPAHLRASAAELKPKPRARAKAAADYPDRPYWVD